MLTQDRLKELLDYDPETGVFRWAQSRGRMRKGSVAGRVHPFTGYHEIKVDRKMYRAHRLAWLYMYGCWPADQIDHISGHKLDNRIENLREADGTENRKNQGIRIDNTSGHTGVYWHKQRRKWRVRIDVDGEIHNLGYFENLEDAVAARKAAEVKYGFHPNHGTRPSESTEYKRTYDRKRRTQEARL